MKAETYLPVVNQLAIARGLDPSQINLIESDRFPDVLLYGDEKDLIGQCLRLGSKTRSLDLYFPLSETDVPYAYFPKDVFDGFQIKTIGLEYDIKKNPQFRGILEEVKRTKSIPIEEISRANELIINNFSDDPDFHGSVSYKLGSPSLERLCVEVDANRSELVPDAQEQPEQNHYCINGMRAPLIPLYIPKFSIIRISLEAQGYRASNYLKVFLQDLPIQQYNFNLTVDDGDGLTVDRSACWGQFRINIINPEQKRTENAANAAVFMERLEGMFK